MGDAFEIQAPIALVLLNPPAILLNGVCILGCMLAWNMYLGHGNLRWLSVLA